MTASISDGLVDDGFVAAELAVRHHGAERLDHHPYADQRRDVGRVVRRRHLDDLEAAEAFGRDEAEKLQRLARQETAWLRPAGAGHEAAIDRIDVERDIDRIR